MDGNIFNSNGVHVGPVIGREIFDLKEKGVNLYRPSGDLVGHLASGKAREPHDSRGLV